MTDKTERERDAERLDPLDGILPPLGGQWDYKGDDSAWVILYRWHKKYEHKKAVTGLFLRSDGILHSLARAINTARDAALRDALVGMKQIADALGGKTMETQDQALAIENLQADVANDAALRRAMRAEIERLRARVAEMEAAPAGKPAPQVAPAPRLPPDLAALVLIARAAYDAMTPEQQAAHDAAQRESFVRGNIGLDRDERREAAPKQPPEGERDAG